LGNLLIEDSYDLTFLQLYLTTAGLRKSAYQDSEYFFIPLTVPSTAEHISVVADMLCNAELTVAKVSGKPAALHNLEKRSEYSLDRLICEAIDSFAMGGPSSLMARITALAVTGSAIDCLHLLFF
jgi:hypothetical protein